MRRRKLFLPALGAALALLVAVTAWGYWTSVGSGTASAGVGTVSPPTGVTVPASSTGTVHVTWTASSTSGGAAAPDGYYAERNDGTSWSLACGSSPAPGSLITGTGCDDAVSSAGDFTYRVTAVFRTWTAQSAPSGSVHVVTDAAAPAVSVTTVNGNVVTFPFTTSQNVTSIGGSCGNAPGDLAPVGWSIGARSGTATCAGGAWTSGAFAAISAESAYTAAASQSDSASNTGTDSRLVTIDKTGPVVTLTAPANGSSTGDVTPTLSGAAGTVSGDSSTVTVKIYNGAGTGGTVAQTLTPTRAGAGWTIDAAALAPGVYTAQATQTDAAANLGTSSASTFTILDTVGPTVTINQAAAQADPTNASPINFTVVFSESVANFVTGDVTLGGTAGATTATVTGSGTTYNVAVSGMTLQGTAIASIAAAKATDAAGNANAASTSTDNSVTRDTLGPGVTVNQAAGQADPTAASTINFTVVFSESVANFVTGDVTLSGTAGATTATVTGSGTTYNVAVSGMTLQGTVTASIAAAKATDAAGNNNSASTSTDNTVASDTVAPAVTLTAPADGSSTVDTTPALSGAAGNASGDSATVTVKIYNGTGTGGTVVQTIPVTRSLATWSTAAATLPQGTYTVQATQTDTIGNVGASSANTFTVDTVAPTVTINQAAGQADPSNTSPINFTVVFSESVANFVSADVSLGGTAGGTATVTGSGTTYNVAVSGMSAQGTVTATIAAAKATDAAGNANSASTSTDNTVTRDAAAPAVTLTAPAGGSSTSDTTPALSGAAGNASGDSATVNVTIYAGTGTGGSVVETIPVTRTTATWSTTAAALPEGTYTAQATQADNLGNVGTSSANTFTVDSVAPALTTLRMLDSDTDGRVDRVVATFSENIVSSTATAPWTLAGVPSGGSLASVSTSGTQATLALTEGAGVADTSVGSFTVALAQGATGIRDAAGNQSSFAARAPSDAASPVLISVASANGGAIVRRMEANDSITFNFSEALNAATVPATVSVREERAGTSSFSIFSGAPTSFAILASASPIVNAYLGANPSSGTATGTVVLSNGNKTITVTLGPLTTTGNGVGTGTAAAVTFVPNSGLADAAGNGAAGSRAEGAFGLF